MRHVLSIALGCVFAYASAFGQSKENLTFEVASVRPSPAPAPNERLFFGPPRGGPGTRDPERITWTRAALRNILMTAYDVQTFQISAPDWLSTARYDIAANVLAGATKQQVNVMWQNLLNERFALALHHESKEFQVDELTVAKGGPKLKETDLGPNPDPFTPPEGPPKPDKNGMLEMNGFGYIVMISADSAGPRAHAVAKGLTLADFAARLGQNLGHPVIDKTGLTGRYDFTLEYVPDLSGMQLPPPPPGAAGPPPSATGATAGASDPGSNLATAVEKQLGLKLSRAKAQLDMIVVDHVEKTPAQN